MDLGGGPHIPEMSEDIPLACGLGRLRGQHGPSHSAQGCVHPWEWLVSQQAAWCEGGGVGSRLLPPSGLPP